MSHAIHGKRVAEIENDIAQGFPDEGIDPEDATWLILKLREAWSMLSSQQRLMDDAIRRWRKIGYDEGYSTGFADALEIL